MNGSSVASRSDARLIGVVFSVYRESLIKNVERSHQKVGTVNFKKIIGSQYTK